MDWKHVVLWVVIFVAGFYVAKKYPALFASVPGLSSVLA